MTQPYVSSYDQVFLDAFDKGIKEMPERLPDLVKTTLDKFYDEVLSNIQTHILDEMKSNLDAEIRGYAAEVASSMLMNALAGDNKEIRNLFGFSDWYMKHLYVDKKPTQWALIDAIVRRAPDVFVNELIAQRNAEIALLNERVANLRRQIDYMKENGCRP